MKAFHGGSSFLNKLVYDSRILKYLVRWDLKCMRYQTENAIEDIPFAVAEFQFRDREVAGRYMRG